MSYASPWEMCTCGGAHHPGASYYVSVMDGSPERVRLVAGPFTTHAQARGWIEPANTLVIERYNPDGRAHFYAYGTLAMAPSYTKPGVLNDQLGVPRMRPEESP